jgi:hypothetical protein
MRCGTKTAHPAHPDYRALGGNCIGVTSDDAVAYAIIDAAEELLRRWERAWGDDAKLPESARIEMHPAILNALYRQEVYPAWHTLHGIGLEPPDLSKIIGIPVVVKGYHGEKPEWRLIVSSGVLDA